ncbi:hypothetical protein [Paenibacillus daejeonensis]|uniref:hypothetical protein n=1 Tax=Paenibacillus daejeonensis TaxID=135193 RepID=UPI000374EA91|nr:hypothetical protein [Paenibacillus daejeonensis]
MKRSSRFRQFSLLWLAFLIAAAGLPAGQTAGAATTVPDGVYTVDYFYLIDGQNSVSVANNYLKEQGQ